MKLCYIQTRYFADNKDNTAFHLFSLNSFRPVENPAAN